MGIITWLIDVTVEVGLEERFERDFYQIFFKGYIFSSTSVGVPRAESLISIFSAEVQRPTALRVG